MLERPEENFLRRAFGLIDYFEQHAHFFILVQAVEPAAQHKKWLGFEMPSSSGASGFWPALVSMRFSPAFVTSKESQE